jgi:MoaA/NifB/PqqE/SkfB family radical SAM enzyme
MDTYKGDRMMSVETFKTLLEKVPTDVEIHFSGFSELFFHKDYMEILREATKKHTVVIYTTTNGLKLSDLPELSKMTFKQFVIHEIKGARDIDFPFKVERVRVDNPISRGGNLWEIGEHQGSCQKQPYPEQFSQNVLLPNGDVYLCCMDYGLKHKLGNLFETNFNDLKREDKYELCKTQLI